MHSRPMTLAVCPLRSPGRRVWKRPKTSNGTESPTVPSALQRYENRVALLVQAMFLKSGNPILSDFILSCTAQTPSAQDHNGQPADFDFIGKAIDGTETGSVTWTVDGQSATRSDGVTLPSIDNPAGLPTDATDATTRFQPYGPVMRGYSATNAATATCDGSPLAQTAMLAIYHCAAAELINGRQVQTFDGRIQFNNDPSVEAFPPGAPLPKNDLRPTAADTTTTDPGTASDSNASPAPAPPLPGEETFSRVPPRTRRGGAVDLAVRGQGVTCQGIVEKYLAPRIGAGARQSGTGAYTCKPVGSTTITSDTGSTSAGIRMECLRPQGTQGYRYSRLR